LVERPERYLSFLGSPLEASQGCSEHCTFCLVHSMQPAGRDPDLARLREDLVRNPREFVSVVDYNLGDRRERLLTTARELGLSAARGWTCEACLESLDSPEVVAALAAARCRVAYCGLESVSDAALKSIAKTQNAVSAYRRVIRGAQEAGLEIASGFILGLAGAGPDAAFADFAEEAGLVYVKLTFLTFNPGTKALAAMSERGRVLTDDPSAYDGTRVTWLAPDSDAPMLRAQAGRLISRLYSWRSAWRRSRHLAGDPLRRAEFVLLSRCFGEAYRDWRRLGVLTSDAPRLLASPWRKPAGLAAAEAALAAIRRLRD
ncbi:MAG: radical SAM protein, partial [Elusimicrobiota bacterium]